MELQKLFFSISICFLSLKAQKNKRSLATKTQIAIVLIDKNKWEGTNKKVSASFKKRNFKFFRFQEFGHTFFDRCCLVLFLLKNLQVKNTPFRRFFELFRVCPPSYS